MAIDVEEFWKKGVVKRSKEICIGKSHFMFQVTPQKLIQKPGLVIEMLDLQLKKKIELQKEIEPGKRSILKIILISISQLTDSLFDF